MTDADAGRRLRAASDALLRDLDALASYEEEKRTLEPQDPRRVELSEKIQALAGRLLESSAAQRRLTVGIQQDAETAAVSVPIDETPRSIAAILESWRDAERRLAAAEPGSVEAEVATDEIARFRDEYRRTYERHDRPG
jgi:hypothetical protein